MKEKVSITDEALIVEKKIEGNDFFKLQEQVQSLESQTKGYNVRFQHLESIGTPQWYEQGLEECKDVVTKLQNDLEVLKNQVKTWMESFQTETILLFEAQHWMKVSGCTHQELCDVLHADVSTISRILNGKKVREDKNDFAKIKAYCIQKMAKEMKIEPKEDKERESYINNTNVGNV